jgi:hypothetical protein
MVSDIDLVGLIQSPVAECRVSKIKTSTKDHSFQDFKDHCLVEGGRQSGGYFNNSGRFLLELVPVAELE